MVGGALSLSGIGPIVRDEAGKIMRDEAGKISYPREQRTGAAFVNAVAYGGEEMTYEAGGWDIR